MKSKAATIILILTTGLLVCTTSFAERYYYAGLTADEASREHLSGFALYKDETRQTYAILAVREYPIMDDDHVYPGRIHGVFTDNGRGVLTSTKLFMRFYDDFVDSKDFCDVPIEMTLVWNKNKTAMRAENVILPNRYPRRYWIFGCETLRDSDMTGPTTLTFHRSH